MNNRTAVWISLLLFFVYLLSYSGVYHAVDEMSALAVTESLLTGQWSVNQMEWDQSRTPPQNEVGVDGNLYSKKGLAISLAALPLFAVGKWWHAVGAVQMVLLLNPILTALLVFVFFHLTKALGYDERTATIGTLSLGLGTLLWPFARTIFSESLAALGLCLALFGVVALRSALVDTRSLLPAFIAGSGAAILLLARTANAVVLPVIGLYLCYLFLLDWRKNGRISRLLPPAVAFGLPIVLSLLAVVLYNYLRFHTLLTFPLAPFERFSNPLRVGLVGLLLSPGKGLVWYVPLVWLILPALFYWIKMRRLAEGWLAIGVVVATLLLYAQWYDWPGGRAWGPRMLVMTMPALVMFCLPALAAWGSINAHRWQRALLTLVLSLSLVVQCLGVLVNFERQEGLDMQSGLTFNQLLWDVAHSPLLTYWRKIVSSADPLWLQPFFWRNPGWLLAGLLLSGGILLALLHFARPGIGPVRWSRWTLLATGILLAGFACAVVVAAKADPRWQERSADPQDNIAVVEFLAQNSLPSELVLLDLLPENDLAGRTAFWMNQARQPAHTIGWLRKPVMTPEVEHQLADWIRPYRRVWLTLQSTDENAPDSTTEQWLDQTAYRGRQNWIGSQRVVEYLLPPANGDTEQTNGSLVFGENLGIVTYTVQPGQAAGQELVRLMWASQPDPKLRFSIQALDSSGRLVTQVDRAPGQLTNAEHAFLDQIGVQVAEPRYTLIIKIYYAEGGAVVPVQVSGAAPAEYAVLFTTP